MRPFTRWHMIDGGLVGIYIDWLLVDKYLNNIFDKIGYSGISGQTTGELRQGGSSGPPKETVVTSA